MNREIKIKLICLFISLIFISGCVENDFVNGIKIPNEVTDSWNDAINFADSFFSSLDYSIDIEPVINAMNYTIHQLPEDVVSIKVERKEVVQQIGDLPKFENDTLYTFEGYKQFADDVNFIIELLNRECGFEIKLLEKSTDEYHEISKFIERYTPLVGNYNDVVESARNYNESNEESVKQFYIDIGVFGFELALIFGHVWYKTTYKVVGVFYRASGLNRLAFKCPTLVATILSTAHWELRNKLVDETSNLLKRVLLRLPGDVLTDLTIKTIS